MWLPQFTEQNQPLYLLIADAIERDIAAGRLLPGERLPTLKELAAALQVTPGTVGRGYDEAGRRGLLVGEVGRGTFVARRAEPSAVDAPSMASGQIDLSIIKPNDSGVADWLPGALAELAHGTELSRVLDYSADGGHVAHKQAGAAWVGQRLPGAAWQQIVLTSGAQHGLMVAIGSLTQHDDLILCEELCYPGIISLAHGLGRRLKGVRIDAHGMLPESLRELCAAHRPKLLICVASHHNPCNSIMPSERRAEIAAIAREFELFIVDDDIYGFLEADNAHAPLAAFAPERSIYLTSLSKSILPALRIGYLHAPQAMLSRFASMVRSSVWMPSPLMAQLASELIDSGQGRELAARQRQEAALRQQMARDILGIYELRGQANGYHVWLELPQPWSSDEFAYLARANGVSLVSGSQFLAERSGTTRGVRIALMAPSRDELRLALTKLAGLLAAPEPRLFY
ncbi:PLP-dependent aminotransferase family protein [Pseudomonas sp. CAU 1711]|uniref:aminotransferase-like domain-containing protein n=1 Tax=Pseudomonas sp. CAU 1711 TaxID=3140356 RepID=UPI003260EC2E